jgi:Zn-dependent M28 family amino/carboxypeptidase
MRLLASRGAAGVLLVYTPEAEETLPWARFVQASRAEELAWLDGARLGDGVQGLPARAVVSVRGLEKIAVAAGVPGGARGILERAAAGRLTAQAWALRARIQSRSELRETRSVNVLGLLRGSDPALAGEAVVITAHLDQRGVGEPARGDAMQQGAGDGAASVAVLLEVARAFASLPRRPARSILFAAVTGGEEGSVGASYLARHPAPAASTVVAALEVDGAPTASPFLDAVAPGAEHSSLGAQVRSAAAGLGVELSPVPAPRAAAFLRSDAGSFARRGIPAMSVSPGRGVPPDGEPGARDAVRRDRDPARRVGWDAGWRWDDAARFARLPFLAAWLVADAPARPAWNPGDPFARLAPRR